MSNDEAEKEQAEQFRAEQQLLHALLQGLHEADVVREHRIATTMQRFEKSQKEASQTAAPRNEPLSPILEAPQILVDKKSPIPNKMHRSQGSTKSKTRQSRNLQWLATVAAVMVAGFFWNQFLQPAQLDAAVDLIELAAIEPVTRIYDIRVQAELRSGGKFSKLGRLHTKSTDQFVVSMDERSKRPVIFGVDGQEEWFIVGRRYGTIKEQESRRFQAAFLAERMDRFITSNRLLESLSDNYTVELLKETPPRGLDEKCTGLLGKQIDYDRIAPQEVRVWADPQTGVALRVRLIWKQPMRFKPHEVLLEYVGENTVAEDFYSLDHHVALLGLKTKPRPVPRD